jgi:hypothetical protein
MQFDAAAATPRSPVVHSNVLFICVLALALTAAAAELQLHALQLHGRGCEWPYTLLCGYTAVNLTENA